MKDYDYNKITDRVFSRAEALKAKEKKRRALVGTLTPLCLIVITVSVCLPAMLLHGNVTERADSMEREERSMNAINNSQGDTTCLAADLFEIPDVSNYSIYDYKGCKDKDCVDSVSEEKLYDDTKNEAAMSQSSLTVLREMISESDGIVLATVLDVQKTGAENEITYTLRVLSSYKGALSENDEFTVTVCGDYDHKVGEKKVCFLLEGSEGKELLYGGNGMLSESDGVSDDGKVISIDEFSEEIKRTEETE